MSPNQYKKKDKHKIQDNSCKVNPTFILPSQAARSVKHQETGTNLNYSKIVHKCNLELTLEDLSPDRYQSEVEHREETLKSSL
jgi:hypothetical protein